MDTALPVLKEAVSGVTRDRVPMMGAALAYYTVFSIAPLLVIATGVAGLVFGQRGSAEIMDAVGGVVGPNGAKAIESLVQGAAAKPQAGLVATVAGVVALILGASGVFGQLQEALNVIWKVELRPDAGWGLTLRRRLLSFGMVGVIAFLLLASLLVSAALSAAGKYLHGALPGGELPWQAANALVSFLVITVMFALIYKVLPDARLPWRGALRGGLWTSLLFSIGKLGIGLYLGRSGVASAYGAAGSLVVLLMWVYYSSQIVLFGAELTRAYAVRDGLHPAPKPSARRAHTGTKR
jgi:membrane protein